MARAKMRSRPWRLQFPSSLWCSLYLSRVTLKTYWVCHSESIPLFFNTIVAVIHHSCLSRGISGKKWVVAWVEGRKAMVTWLLTVVSRSCFDCTMYYIVLCCHVLLFVRYDNRSRSLVKSPPVLCRRQWSVRKRTRVTHTTITTTPPLSQICMYCNGGWDVTWFFFAFVSLILAASRLDLGKRTITEEKEATSKHAATKEREKGFTNQSKPSI